SISRALAFLLGAVYALAQIITTIAGTEFIFPAGPIPATSAQLGEVTGLAFDTRGNLYVAAQLQHVIVRISPNGDLFVVAGNARFGFSGDGGPAAAASVNSPTGIAVDAAG